MNGMRRNNKNRNNSARVSLLPIVRRREREREKHVIFYERLKKYKYLSDS